MRTFRFILIGIAALIAANVLTWFLYGQERALLLGTDVEDVAGGIDSLYLFTGYSARHERAAQYADFAPATVQALASGLESTGRTVLVRDGPFPLLDDNASARELLDAPGSGAFAYDVSLDRPFPLGVEVYRLIWAPGFGTHESALYVWFFGWHHMKDTGFSIT